MAFSCGHTKDRFIHNISLRESIETSSLHRIINPSIRFSRSFAPSSSRDRDREGAALRTRKTRLELGQKAGNQDDGDTAKPNENTTAGRLTHDAA
mmetsp:Transcript_14785/g.28630  ORF Transcript_14785/g.28630 Transcript_14785/m.28630 type:complete len:95 (+) Transcript_14785:519-803(+)